MGKKLLLIDGHSILNRAFFGLPDLTNSEGIHTNAVYGFLNILFKILDEEKPDYLTVAFDVHAPTFRHQMFDAYKGTRKPMAEELREQVPLMKEMLKAMGVTIREMPGYEADDLLGTLAVMGERDGMDVSIVSGDRDLLQLATEHTQIRIPKTKRTGTEIENYFAKDVKEHYQVSPKEYIDVKALMGDASDNIPGVPGIGEKTASALIAQYGSIDEVHAHASEVRPPRAANNIVEYWEQACMSKKLATICTTVPLGSDTMEQSRLSDVRALYTKEAYQLCQRLEFKNYLSRFSVETEETGKMPVFHLISHRKDATAVWEKAADKETAFHFAGEEGAAVAYEEGEVFFLKAGEDLTMADIIEGFSNCRASAFLSPDWKSDLKRCGIRGNPFADFDTYLIWRQRFFDTGIAAYLLNPLKGAYPYDDLARLYLNLALPSPGELKDDKAFQTVCYTVYVARKVKPVLQKKLQEEGMDRLFLEIEMPLVFTLTDMELQGISMDGQALKEYGSQLFVSITKLEQKIYEEAGEVFNLNSPKQLGVILFEKMMLPGSKKTKTGYSTSAEVLEKLAPDYPVVSDILEYRQLTKLKSTYADGLTALLGVDGKIHTTFNQTVTATGRLSSTEPNLQNIPIRIELGKQIRKVFHPDPGYVFVDADYSQIELRVLASLSEDERLIEAYMQDKDIHRITASQVFHVPFEEVTPLQRRNAKAVNFGIVYGISSFGLSQDLSISRKEATGYIERYFQTYPKIKEFLDRTVKDAKKKGYTTTLFGRKRPIPELQSSNFMMRSFGERVAMNSPIQGTAADIIKIAMNRVHDRLLQEKLRSRLLLQVHDELLVEAAEEEKEAVEQILSEEMHKAADLAVSLEIDCSSGFNWYDAH